MKNRKWVWVLIAVAIVALLGIGGVSCSKDITDEGITDEEITEEDLINYTEPGYTYTLTGNTAVSPSISPETAKLVKITYEVDENLSVLLMVRKLTLENKSTDRSINRADVSLKVLDDKGNEIFRDDALPFLNIGPGKISSSTGLVAFEVADMEKLKNPKSFVITLESVTWGKTTVSPTPSATPTPSPSVIAEGSPGKVVIAFFAAIKEGRYAAAKEYLSTKSRTDYLSYLNRKLGGAYNSLEEALSRIPKDTIPQKIELTDETIDSEEKTAEVDCLFYTPSGTQKESLDLIFENDLWKLDLP